MLEPLICFHVLRKAKSLVLHQLSFQLTKCICGKDFDALGIHVLSCKRMFRSSSLVWSVIYTVRHNTVNKTIQIGLFAVAAFSEPHEFVRKDRRYPDGLTWIYWKMSFVRCYKYVTQNKRQTICKMHFEKADWFGIQINSVGSIKSSCFFIPVPVGSER